MIDFASVTGVQLPEGSANALAIGSAEVWSAEKWDLEWTYNGSLPPSSVWYYDGPIYNVASVGAINFNSPDYNDADTMARMMLQNMNATSDQSVFEVEFNVDNTDYEFSIRVGTSNSDSHYPSCIYCGIRGVSAANKAGIYVETRASLSSPLTPAAEIEIGKWHKLRLSLDTKNSRHRVYLDGRLISEQTNNTVYDIEISGPSIIAWDASAYVRALRYRKSL